MRYIFTIAAWALCSLSVLAQPEASGQNEEESRMKGVDLFCEFNESFCPTQNDITFAHSQIIMGCHFLKRISASAIYEGELGLYSGEDRDFFTSQALGAGVDVTLLRATKSTGWVSEGTTLDIRCQALASVGSADFKHSSYSVQMLYNMRGPGYGKYMTPVIGIGYRYMDMRTNGFKDTHNFYLSVGIRY